MRVFDGKVAFGGLIVFLLRLYWAEQGRRQLLFVRLAPCFLISSTRCSSDGEKKRTPTFADRFPFKGGQLFKTGKHWDQKSYDSDDSVHALHDEQNQLIDFSRSFARQNDLIHFLCLPLDVVVFSRRIAGPSVTPASTNSCVPSHADCSRNKRVGVVKAVHALCAFFFSFKCWIEKKNVSDSSTHYWKLY